MNKQRIQKVVSWVAWTLIGLVILFAGIRVAKQFIDTKPKAGRAASWTKPAPVVVQALHAERHVASIHAMGTVAPARQLVVQPEVSGKLVEVHQQLEPGGLIGASEVVARIDDQDYELAIQMRRAEIASAQLGLKTEKRRRAVAEQEWSLLGAEVAVDPDGQAMALREPQLASAEAQLLAAKSALELAKLQLSRTSVIAPFNAIVVEEAAEVGQLVTQQTRLATLVGTDEFWVEVAVPFHQLSKVRIPGVNSEEGAPAEIRLVSAGSDVVSRSGRVLRMLGTVDTIGRMGRLLVSVPDPLELARPVAERSVALPIGAYVRVDIEGTSLSDVYSLPHAALHDGTHIHILTSLMELSLVPGDGEGLLVPVHFHLQPAGTHWTLAAPRVAKIAAPDGVSTKLGRLSIRGVEVLHRDGSQALAKATLPPGALLILSRLAAPVEGMWVRPRDEKPAASPAAARDGSSRPEPQGLEVRQ